MGWKTLVAGEKALVYNVKGEARIEEGPKRMFVWHEEFNLLARHAISQNEYLIINNRDGTTKHLPGPAVLHENPMEHSKITVKHVTVLDANEVLIVYRQDNVTKIVDRYFQYGPTHFMPQPNEWLHEFSWHGTDPGNKTVKLPGTLKFTKLQVIPDQFYYNVDEVRTADDATIRVKVMLFYELRNVEKMLEATQDPIADFINCISADVVAFASKLSYIGFIEEATKLNQLETYPQLMERSRSIGFEISKVVFRGYHSGERLQAMHDRAIESRTKVKLDFEKEEQDQILTDMKLKAEMDRITLEQKMEIDKLKHQHTMESSQKKHALSMALDTQKRKVQQWKENRQVDLQGQQAQDEQRATYFQTLDTLNVDLNQYLSAMSRRPDKLIRINANNDATIHLHHT